jgi:hypothetical protein
MLPTITTTHAIPKRMPRTHTGSIEQPRFCMRCLKVLDVSADSAKNGKTKSSHRCEDFSAAGLPSIAIPFN